jgi:hypothetical protein
MIRCIVAAKKLPRGDVLLHTSSTEAKQCLQRDPMWVKKLGNSAQIKQQSFPILAHGVPTAYLARLSDEERARLLQKENERLHPGLKIVRTSWLKNPIYNKKAATTIIIDVANVTQANRLITEGIIIQCELKPTELYEPGYRIK